MEDPYSKFIYVEILKSKSWKIKNRSENFSVDRDVYIQS